VMAELLLDVEVCRLQATVDEVGAPKDDELEEVWRPANGFAATSRAVEQKRTVNSGSTCSLKRRKLTRIRRW
jgi:hypothetical protein